MYYYAFINIKGCLLFFLLFDDVMNVFLDDFAVGLCDGLCSYLGVISKFRYSGFQSWF